MAPVRKIRSPFLGDGGNAQPSSSFSIDSPMMSVTSASPSSCSSMKAASSMLSSPISTSSSSLAAGGSAAAGLFSLARGGGIGRGRLLALLFGLGILKRNEFGIGSFRHNSLSRHHGRSLCSRDRSFGSRARRCRRRNRHYLAGIG